MAIRNDRLGMAENNSSSTDLQETFEDHPLQIMVFNLSLGNS